MAEASSARPDRRAATRYRVPARAQLFWPEGQVARVAVSDISATGCSVIGDVLPPASTRVFLSLDVPGLPNLRLPATALRCRPEGTAHYAAIRFDVPVAGARGLDGLLANRSTDVDGRGYVLVVDADVTSRERISEAVRAKGLRVIAVSSPSAASATARELPIDVVLARADAFGVAALANLLEDAPNALRIGYGKRDALERALALGYVQAVTDDPTSAKCLGSLFSDHTRRD